MLLLLLFDLIIIKTREEYTIIINTIMYIVKIINVIENNPKHIILETNNLIE